jgi:transposase-like protein/IS1 family transposase
MNLYILLLTNNERSLYVEGMTMQAKSAVSVTCKDCDLRCQSIGKHRNGLRRFRCPKCRKSYTEPHRRTLDTMYIRQDRAILALQLLLEGNSLRSTQRITGLDVNTIMTLLVKAGERCQALMDTRLRGLQLKHLELDEVWTYVGKKRRNVREGDSLEVGDQWVFVAIDADTKLIPCFHVGKRHIEDTRTFLWDLYGRIEGRTQITTDGLHHYRAAVPDTFGLDVDFAQLVKLFGEVENPNARYSPPRITEVLSKVRSGNPDPDHISTSFVERQNLTMRMAIRRFTRLTNAFSKKLLNLKMAVALHFAYYNFCRTHKTIRVTPAMEAGITDHVWTIAELMIPA